MARNPFRQVGRASIMHLGDELVWLGNDHRAGLERFAVCLALPIVP